MAHGKKITTNDNNNSNKCESCDWPHAECVIVKYITMRAGERRNTKNERSPQFKSETIITIMIECSDDDDVGDETFYNSG